MAVQQNKVSRSRRNNRRSHDTLSADTATECPNCGELKRHHHVCPSCGYYAEREVFSINEETVISDSTFERLNSILVNQGINVEKVYYREISKFGGLFRCSTLPLNRN